MNAGARLGIYGGGLVVAFVAAFGLAGVVVPHEAVDEWKAGSAMQSHANGDGGSSVTSLKGLSLSAEGLQLSPVSAPRAVGEDGTLSFRVETLGGETVTAFERAHEKVLHLIVVRSDGSEFRHVHPTMDEAGTWSIPWVWEEAGTYRVFADFTPASGDEGVTLTQTVQVDGSFVAVVSEPRRVDQIDGFAVEIEGDLVAGTVSDLRITVSRDGDPVTGLEPYLGAFGHLVALREGDLAYLHVHAAGDAPKEGETSGPEIAFAAEAPPAGRYLLYLDFQVNGTVHTAEFVLDAAHGSTDHETTDETEAPTHSDGH